MTDDQDLLRLIVDLLRGQDGRGDLELTAATPLTDGLELTSLELVRLLVSLEEHLDIQIDDAEIMNANFQTVGDIVSLVSRSLAPSDRAAASGHGGR
jgi:acyl carrier protein